jgi:SnoaL-like protein
VTPGTVETVARFFSCLTAREWSRLATVLSEGVVRIGPFGDELSGREAYLDFLRGTVPTDYRNDVARIIGASDGSAAFATVTEHLRYGDQEFHLDEAYVFDLDENGRICRVAIYWQTPQDDPGGFGSAASGESYASKIETDGPDSFGPRGPAHD